MPLKLGCVVVLHYCLAFTSPWARIAVPVLLLKTQAEERMSLRALVGEHVKLFVYRFQMMTLLLETSRPVQIATKIPGSFL